MFEKFNIAEVDVRIEKVDIFDLAIVNPDFSHNLELNKRFSSFFESIGIPTSINEFILKSKRQSNSFKSRTISKNYPFLAFLLNSAKVFRIWNQSKIKQVSENHTLLFPSFSSDQLFFLVFKTYLARWTTKKVVLRFLLIREESYFQSRSVIAIVKACLGILEKKLGNVILSTELEFSAVWLSNILKRPVVHIPAPLMRNSNASIVKSGRILLLGSPRIDKGFNDLFPLSEALFKRFPHYRIISQSGTSLKKNTQWESKPDESCKVEFLPNWLSSEELIQQVINCEFLLASHLPKFFKLRGTSVLTYALEYGKPIIVREGTALGDHVSNLKIGITYINEDDLVNQLMQFSDQTYESFVKNIESEQKSTNEYVERIFRIGE